jgi:FOG: EAL domain
MQNADASLEVMNRLRSMGVRISIDDFGTGYSSLSRLPRYPIDALKIDRVFISQMSTDHDNHEIVRLIISLGPQPGTQSRRRGN